MKNLRLDLHKIQSELNEFSQLLSQSHQTLRSIGEIDVAQTPSTCIFKRDKLSALYFKSTVPRTENTSQPLLICYALVNRWYMIDLDPERSLLKSLLDRGHDIYVIDWGYPDKGDRFLDLDDYINDYLDDCVNHVLNHAGSDHLDLLGICQGGTFSLCYAAINPSKVRKVITMVTPVDFRTPDNTLQMLAQHIDVDLAIKTYGNIPGTILNHAYSSLMPMRLGLQKNLGMPKLLSDAPSALRFLRMEKWIYDSPDQAGAAFKEFQEKFFRGNGLINGELFIGNHKVSLSNVQQPILNIFGEFDHLVPPAASKALRTHCSSNDYSELAVKAGHIGVFVSGKARDIVPSHISQWLAK